MTEPAHHPTVVPVAQAKKLTVLSIIAFCAGLFSLLIFVAFGRTPAALFLAAPALVLSIIAVARPGKKWMAVVGIVAASVGLLAALAAIGGGPAYSSYNPKTLASTIQKQAAAQDVVFDVNCPPGAKFGAGDKMQCTGTYPDGSTVIIDVEVQNNQGDFIWSTR